MHEPLSHVLEVLQAELADLAVEAKSAKGDGLAGQITSLFTSSQHKDVKAAAENAQVVLRNIAKGEGLTALVVQEASKDVVDAVLLACGRNKSLCVLGLPILQKLVANNLLSEASCRRSIALLHHISSSKAHDDESIKLKLLQTCLTILQLPFGIDHFESTRQVLALCFHVLSTRNASTVITTASATVRQAVTLVFDHVSSPQVHPAAAGELASLRTPPLSPRRSVSCGGAAASAPPDAGERFRLHRTATGSCVLTPLDAAPSAEQSPGGAPPQQVALRLLQELCLMARGNPSEWLESRALSATFVLDLLSQIARSHTHVFRAIPAFLEVLREDVCGSLMHCVRQQLDADTEHVQVGTLRVGLHCLSIVIINYSFLMATKAEMLLTLVLDGCHNATHYAQQVLCMQAMRSVCYSAPIVHFLYTTYDMKLDYKLRAVQSILATACDFISVFITATVDNGDAEALQLLSTLWQQKIHNRQLSFEAEFASHVSTGYGGMYIVLLAIDTINALVHSVETIAEHAVYPPGAGPALGDLALRRTESGTPPPATAPDTLSPGDDADAGNSVQLMMHRMTSDADGTRFSGARPTASAATALPGASQADIWSQIAPTTPESARILVDAVWQKVLAALVDLVGVVSGEVLVLQLLRCFQSFTQAAGELRMDEPFTSFLSAVCDLTVYEEKPLQHPPPRSEATSGELAGAPAADVEPSPRPRAKAREGKVLTPKNVHALRTVFNIAHRLAEKLGPAWTIVLTALDKLDGLLHSPSTTTQQGSASSAAATNDDLHILSAAASQLFHATATMSDDAVMSMLLALKTVIQRKLQRPAGSQAGAQVKQANCYALDRMVDILEHNRARAAVLWPVFVDQVALLARHEDAVERAAATRILLRATLALLGQALAPADGDARRSDSADAALEEQLLTSLVALQSAPGVAADARYAVVEVALHVLQGFGDKLTVGWLPLLQLLEDVAGGERESARLVRLAHECCDLVVTDYLPLVPCQHLRRALRVEAAFVKQAVDVNICYSASLNLWRVADNLGRALRRLRGAGDAGGAEELSEGAVATHLTASAILASLTQPLTLISSLARSGVLEDPGPDRGARADSNPGAAPRTAGAAGEAGSADAGEDDVVTQLAASLTYADCEALLLFVLECAHNIALEARPEIRTSGIKLLFDVMTRHASLLPEQEGSLWRMSFPLVMEVVEHVRAGAAAPQAAADPDLPRVLPVHHSHDSEVKRWLETLEKAIKGWSAYLRGSLATVLRLPSFASDWDALMGVLESLVCMTSLPGDASGRKVAQASLTFFASVVAPHARAASLPEGLWLRAFEALERCAAALAEPATVAHVSIRQSFVCTFAAVYVVAPARVSPGMYNSLLARLGALASHPVAATEKWPVGDVLPPVLASIASVLPSLLPPSAPECWPHVARFFCLQISTAKAAATDAAAPGGRAAAVALLWMEEMIAQLVTSVWDAMPWQQRAANLAACVAALSAAMQLQYTLPDARVWSAAAKHFTTLVGAGLPAVNIAYVNGQADADADGVWSELADAFEGFLHGPDYRGRSSSAAASLPSTQSLSSLSLQAGAQGPTEAPLVVERPAGSAEAGTRDPELEACVLDCLTDSVLASCGHTTSAMRRRLVAILDAGCAASADSHRPPAQRLAHMCLRKLFVICGRGIQSSGGHLDVATIALPLLLRRCDKTLRLYSSYRSGPAQSDVDGSCASSEARDAALDALTPRTDASSTFGAHSVDPPQALTDFVVSALEVLSSMWLSPAVVDKALPVNSSLGTLVRVARQHAASAAVKQRPSEGGGDGREQTHLLMVYDAVVMCAEGRDRAVRAAVRRVLLEVGRTLGMPSRAWM